MTLHTRNLVRVLPALGLAMAVLAGCGAADSTRPIPTLGPPPDVVVVRGSIEATEAGAFTVRGADGTQRIGTDDKTGYGVMTNAGLDAVGPGDFVGITSERLPNGELRAVEVHIFPESMRGTGEGHYPWDIPRPGGTTMTNASVAAAVTEVDGSVLTLSPKGQDVPITVPPDAPVVRIDLRAAADVVQVGHGAVAVARKAANGDLVAVRVYTGEGGAMPAL